MYLSGYYKESINEGSGLRSVLFISGCKHACEGCFNTNAWDFKHGEEFTIKRQLEIIDDVKSNPLLDGITLCGGDPFFSTKEVIPFIKLLREQVPNISVWSYSGFTYEEICSNRVMKQLLLLCDVLIDGRFILAERDTTLLFRGSRNQRIIDVKESQEKGCVTLLTSVK
ncbi:anaerobic ribonucleoside-triphosphate reductase activating protein [Paenibacillus sp. FSL R7-0302]|uniref:anaerobic ribonucleoside-triphosphate reductase activating protein n=1 Tax=Paenibacillus sp. FSL R7-0302 TaxID=2921681 RepID=UPI0030FAA024